MKLIKLFSHGLNEIGWNDKKKVNGKKWRCEMCVFVPMESSCNVAIDFDKEPRLWKA
jgi:hypothetical protein